MKKFILSIISLLFISTNAHAILPFGIYYGVKGGMTMQNKDIKQIVFNNEKTKNKKNNYFASANVGIKFLKFRGELEYTIRPETTKLISLITDKKIMAQNLMGNLYYNFLELPLLKFYINAGAGETKFTGSSSIETKNNFTWLAGLGINLSLLDVVNVDVGYRYVDMGTLEFKNGEKNDKQAHDIYVGLRFGF